MAWIEQTERRGQKAKYYQDDTNPGKFRAVFSIHDQHYKDDLNQWQEVDETLVDDLADGFIKKSDKTRHAIRFGLTGDRRWYPRRNVTTEYVGITNIQYWRTQGGGSWRNLNLPAAVWKSQGAEWDMTNLYASITNTWKRIKSDFVLKDATAPSRLRFAVTFTGLTYNHESGELTSTTDGLVWGTIDKPAAMDANGVDVPVTTSYDGTYIEWSVNTSGATYPITVDPTLTIQPDATDGLDTMLYSGSGGTNYGTNTSLAYGCDAGPIPYRTLNKFDLSSLDGTETFTSVTLSYYAYGGTGVEVTVAAYRQKRIWVESEATWNSYSSGNNWQTAGGFGADDCEQTNIGSLVTSASSGWVDIPLTPTNKTDLDLGNGFLVKTTSEGTANSCYTRSSDYATAGERPKLVIEYTEAGGTEYEYSISGSSSLAGTVVMRTGKVTVGDLTSAGVLVNSTLKVLAGAVTSAGTVVMNTGKALVGELTSSGVVTTAKTTAQALAGELTSAGAVIIQTGKSIAGAVTSSGVLANTISKILSGEVTSSGDVIKRTITSLAGEIIPSGVVTTVKAALLSLDGTLTTAGDLLKRTGKLLEGTLTPDGSVIKQTSNFVSGVVTSSGELIKQTLKILSGDLLSSGVVTLIKSTLLSLAGTLTSGGTLVIQTNKVLSGTLSSVGNVLKRTYKILSGVLTSIGNLLAVSSSTTLIAADDNYLIGVNTTLDVSAPGVLSNDIGTGVLSAIQMSDPPHGTLVIFNSDGSFTYIPNVGWVGTDTFAYVANDGIKDSNVATVTIITAVLYATRIWTLKTRLFSLEVSPRTLVWTLLSRSFTWTLKK